MVVICSDPCSSIISSVSKLKNVLITAIFKAWVTSFDVILPSNPIIPTLVNLTQQSWLLAWKFGLATYLFFFLFFQIHHGMPLFSDYTSLNPSVYLRFITVWITRLEFTFLLRRVWLCICGSVIYQALTFTSNTDNWKYVESLARLHLMLVCSWWAFMWGQEDSPTPTVPQPTGKVRHTYTHTKI